VPIRKLTKRRLGVCSALVVVVFSVLAARVGQLQLMSGGHYKQIALEQRLRTVPLPAERGTIFDRNGRDLAMSVQRATVYADPVLVNDPVGHAAKLAPLLGVSQSELTQRLGDKSHRFTYLARRVDDSVASAVQELGLPGIGFQPESARRSPAGPLAAAVLGHVGTDGYGLDGLEYLYDDVLTGQPGEIVVEQDQQGRDIPGTERHRVEARRGSDLVLTIDRDLQYEVESSLLDQVVATAAKGGMAVVVDVPTGDVLAMATVEGATAQEQARVAVAGEHNSPLVDLFEPGSTNKVITLSTALEHGKVAPDSWFSVPDWISVDPELKPYEDAEPHPVEQWTTADILRESSNVGTIMIAQRLGNHELGDALRAFGLGTRTNIDFPGQAEGILLDPDEYYSTGLASSSIGYGVAVTAMQMLGVYTTIANDGVSVPARLVDATIGTDGTRDLTPKPKGGRVVSTNTAQVMTGMLEGVVTNGTGACAAIPGYATAGKTGTSHKALPEGGYSDTTMASFIGYVPAKAPRLAAVVVLDEPQSEYGGAAAAPVYAEIMQFALTQYRVAPDDTANAQFDSAHARAQNAGLGCTVPHGDALQSILAARSAAAQGSQDTDGQQDDGESGANDDSTESADSLSADTSPSN
jgi:cell division protein FtsI (penicillin-binding protein 3)